MISRCGFAVEPSRRSTAGPAKLFAQFQGFRTAGRGPRVQRVSGVKLRCECRQRVQSRGSVAIPRKAGIGAVHLFPHAPAKVPKLNRHRSLSLAGGMGLRAPFQPCRSSRAIVDSSSFATNRLNNQTSYGILNRSPFLGVLRKCAHWVLSDMQVLIFCRHVIWFTLTSSKGD